MGVRVGVQIVKVRLRVDVVSLVAEAAAEEDQLLPAEDSEHEIERRTVLLLHQVGQDDLLRLLVQDLDRLQPQLGPGNPDPARERCEVLFRSVVLHDFPLARCLPEQVAPAVGKGARFLFAFELHGLGVDWSGAVYIVDLGRSAASHYYILLNYHHLIYLHLLIKSSHYSWSEPLVTHFALWNT